MTHLRVTSSIALLRQIDNKITVKYSNDTINVYYYKNNVLYYLPYLEQYQIGDSLLSEETKYSYFIFNKDSSSGYFFKYQDDTTKPIKVSVDSILSKRVQYDIDFQLDDRCKLIERNVDNESVVVEKYYDRDNSLNIFYQDSIYIYFDERLNNIDLSIAKSIERIKKQKISKVRLIFNKKYSEQHHAMLPKREMCFEIKKIENKNSSETINFIEKLNKIINAQFSTRSFK